MVALGIFLNFPMPGIVANHAFHPRESRIGASKELQWGLRRVPKKRVAVPQFSTEEMSTRSACRPPEFKTYVCCPLADHLVVQRRIQRLHLVREGGHWRAPRDAFSLAAGARCLHQVFCFLVSPPSVESLGFKCDALFLSLSLSAGRS